MRTTREGFLIIHVVARRTHRTRRDELKMVFLFLDPIGVIRAIRG
jgi:hypothetical protein